LLQTHGKKYLEQRLIGDVTLVGKGLEAGDHLYIVLVRLSTRRNAIADGNPPSARAKRVRQAVPLQPAGLPRAQLCGGGFAMDSDCAERSSAAVDSRWIRIAQSAALRRWIRRASLCAIRKGQSERRQSERGNPKGGNPRTQSESYSSRSMRRIEESFR
jgi:hypothetical protein